MRLEVAFADRVGIASEILAVLARRRLNVVAVEVEPPHIYMDVPGFAEDALDELRRALGEGRRRRGGPAGRHAAGRAAAAAPRHAARRAGRPGAGGGRRRPRRGRQRGGGAALGLSARRRLAGTRLEALFDDPDVGRALLAKGFRQTPREATVRGTPFLIETRPMVEGGRRWRAG